ncbi:MAG: hypothetical protein IJY79_01470 [Clostridia bacterium]|nr:hypothetical protein [Clostridia bacterium]
MNKAKKLIALLLCAFLCAFLCPFALAAEATPTITISTESAMPGDSVTISIDISDNPGIMAMAFCITYDNTALEYTAYSKGYLSSNTIKNHSDKGHISFVNVESSDKATNGTMLSVIFKVKDDAAPGKYTISLANSNRDKYGYKLHNSFSNSKQQFIVPTVKAGSITVLETCENAGHKYGEWNIISEAGCTTTGLKQRTCQRCKAIDEVVTPITHDFEKDWTVDKAATPEEDGIMSRHCTKCDEVTDKITFSYEEIGGDNTDDTSSEESSGDASDNNNNSSDISSENSSDNNISSDESNSGNSSSEIDVNNSQTNSTPTQTPIINNTEGPKNPLSEVEKLEDYI